MWNKHFPDAAFMAKPHHVTAAIPSIEIADDGNTSCIRCPYSETDALYTFHPDRMRAQFFIGTMMRPFRQEPDVDIAQNRRETVWVFHYLNMIAPVDFKTIGKQFLFSCNFGDKQGRNAPSLHGRDFFACG